MAGCEVDGPLWAILAALGACVGRLGSLSGPLWAVWGRYRGLCGRSWVAIGAPVGSLGPLSGPLRAVLGRSFRFPRGEGCDLL